MHLPGSNMYGKMIKNEDIQKYLDLGYVFGINPDVSKNSNKGSIGKFWIYNKITFKNKQLNDGEEIPDGWIKGYHPNKKKSKNAIRIINTSTNETKLIEYNEPIPDGWIKRPYNNGKPRKKRK